MNERLFQRLQSEHQAEALWAATTSRKVLLAWAQQVQLERQQRLQQLNYEHTWTKVRGWLHEIQQARAVPGQGGSSGTGRASGSSRGSQHKQQF